MLHSYQNPLWKFLLKSQPADRAGFLSSGVRACVTAQPWKVMSSDNWHFVGTKAPKVPQLGLPTEWTGIPSHYQILLLEHKQRQQACGEEPEMNSMGCLDLWNWEACFLSCSHGQEPPSHTPLLMEGTRHSFCLSLSSDFSSLPAYEIIQQSNPVSPGTRRCHHHDATKLASLSPWLIILIPKYNLLAAIKHGSKVAPQPHWNSLTSCFGHQKASKPGEIQWLFFLDSLLS